MWCSASSHAPRVLTHASVSCEARAAADSEQLQQCDCNSTANACLVHATMVHGYVELNPFWCSYSVEGHKALQDAGFAPRLHGCEQLPGRWLMVAMECLLGASMWNRIDGMDKPREALRAAVAALHEAGFVHGDLRECNILVKKQQVCTDLCSGLRKHARVARLVACALHEGGLVRDFFSSKIMV